MHIGIYANEERDIEFFYTNKLISILNDKNLSFSIFENYKQFASNDTKILDMLQLVKTSDVMVVLGGDGTMLNVVKYCAKYDVPVVGINLGNLGFLADASKTELEKLVNALEEKQYELDKRSLLEIKFKNKTYYALNDAVLSKGINTRPVAVATYVDETLQDNYLADGIIVSTPTGSTAYALSVGGPILSPDIKGLVVIPIAPHSLHSRPLVISDKHSIKLIPKTSQNTSQLVVDGVLVDNINIEEQIIIEKSKYKASFIRFGNDNFYCKLLKKLNRWGITVQKE